MSFALLSQAAYYVPSLLAHLVAFALAGAIAMRARAAALLLAGGTALQLFASLMSFSIYAGTTLAYQTGEYSPSEISMVSGVVGLVASVVRAVGEVGVVAAVGFAVLRAPLEPAAAVDPYGFPPKQ
jgi:hypothetical protein